MIRNKLIEQDEESRELYDIISNEIGEEIDQKSRRQDIAYARVVFAKILLDAGHRPQQIADQINKDRSSVYHYEKVFYSYYTQSKSMNDLYNKSLKIFNKKGFKDSVNNQLDNANNLAEIKILMQEVKELKIQNLALKQKTENNIGIDVDRFSETFKAITLNVKKGREELMASKIYNTINTVNSSLVY